MALGISWPAQAAQLLLLCLGVVTTSIDGPDIIVIIQRLILGLPGTADVGLALRYQNTLADCRVIISFTGMYKIAGP